MPFAISTEMDYLGETSPQARFANVPFEYSIASRSLDRSSRFTRVVRLLAQQENLFTSGQKNAARVINTKLRECINEMIIKCKYQVYIKEK